MIPILAATFLFYLFSYNRYKNKNVINLVVIIWSIIILSLIVFKPILMRHTQTQINTELLMPMFNDLNSDESFYTIEVDSNIIYKTNKINVIPEKKVNIEYKDTIPTITKYYTMNGNLWNVLTLYQNKKLTKAIILIPY